MRDAANESLLQQASISLEFLERLARGFFAASSVMPLAAETPATIEEANFTDTAPPAPMLADVRDCSVTGLPVPPVWRGDVSFLGSMPADDQEASAAMTSN
eukprot:scaffold197193_cov34-Prasinocladus_malaysianus.AAC.1